MDNRKTISLNSQYLFLILAIFALKFISLGIYDFHHPSEIRYATIAMRMTLSGNYLMPYFTPDVPFFGKPPLFIWASALAFKIFGFSELIGRLPHFLALLATCWFLYQSLKKLYDQKTALVAVLMLGSLGLFYALHSVMSEAFLLLGMSIFSLSFLIQIKSPTKNIYGYCFFVGAAISMLTKGPVGIFLPGLAMLAYLTYLHKWREFFSKFPIFSGGALFLALSLPWFILAEIAYPGFLNYFILGENLSRLTKASWQGDMYGRAHQAPMGKIWWFFIIATLPTILFFLARPKTLWTGLRQYSKADEGFLFFILSALLPLLFLTFMKNMIITYALYSLMPCAVIMARIIILKNWDKITIAIAYSTIGLYLLAIGTLLINPPYLAEKLNYQSYLIKHIPAEIRQDHDFHLYYFGIERNLFGGYWYSKDQVVILNQDNLIKLLDHPNAPIYVIGAINLYDGLKKSDQQKLTPLICAIKSHACLYQAKPL